MFKRDQEREVIPCCNALNVGILPFFPLAGGFLTGKYRRGAPAPPGSRGEKSPYVQQYMTDEHYDKVEKLTAWAEERERARKEEQKQKIKWVRSLEDELKYGDRATETAETVVQTSKTTVETSKTVTVQEQEKTQSANKLIEAEKAKTAQSNELLKKATQTAAAETAAAQKAIAEADAAKAAAQKARADADAIIANWMKARQKEAEEKSIKIDDAP